MFSVTFRGVVTLSLPCNSPSMTLSVIRIDKFCRFACLSIFIFLNLRAPPMPRPILRTPGLCFSCIRPLVPSDGMESCRQLRLVAEDRFGIPVSNSTPILVAAIGIGFFRSYRMAALSFRGEKLRHRFLRLRQVQRGPRHALRNRGCLLGSSLQP